VRLGTTSNADLVHDRGEAPWAEIEAALPRHRRNAIATRATLLRITRRKQHGEAHIDQHPIPAALRKIRQDRGISQAAMADMSGMERCSLVKLEKFGRPQLLTLERWCAGLGLKLALVPLDFVLDENLSPIDIAPHDPSIAAQAKS
jgi:DNA-binding phage protein